MLLRLLALFLFVALACTDQIVQAQDAGVARTMNAAQLFHYAEQARGKGDFETAERAYRALLSDTDARIADEARFRLATLLADGLDRPLEAAVLLRQMLDANPDNAGVRLVLARVLGQLGDRDGATRELRAARAVGLPPQVERQVRFFEAALAGQKRSGLSLEVALAPSTNIARATGSDTLDTVLGEFVLSDDAKARSGVGLSARTQGYVRVPVASRLDWRIEASGAATLYRQADFNDFALQLEAGPEFNPGRSHFALSGLLSHRWYGGAPYALSYGVTMDGRIPVGRRTQMRLGGRAIRQDNLRNDLQDLTAFSLSAGLDRALDAQTGLGLRIEGNRDAARDPGYSTLAGSIRGFAYRQIGRTTLVGDLTYRHLEADRRLLLYPERRRDDYFQAALSGTFRSLSIGTFAPFVRLRYERNASSIAIYDFRRTGADFGLAAAF